MLENCALKPTFFFNLEFSHQEKVIRDGIEEKTIEEKTIEEKTIEEKTIEEKTIEEKTIEVFAHLYVIIPERNQSFIEAAPLSSNNESFSFSSDNEYCDLSRFRPYKKNSNFNDEYEYEELVRTQTVVDNVLIILGNLFLGLEKSCLQKDLGTAEQMKTRIDSDIRIWQEVLKKCYFPHFQDKMNLIFDRASKLLKLRENCERMRRFQRKIFYATLLVPVVGKLIHEKSMMILGLIVSSITLIFMLVHYGITSFKESQLESELKSSIDMAQEEVGKNRVKC